MHMGITIVICVVTAASRPLIHSLCETDMVASRTAYVRLKGSYKIDSHWIYDLHRLASKVYLPFSVRSKQVSESTKG